MNSRFHNNYKQMEVEAKLNPLNKRKLNNIQISSQAYYNKINQIMSYPVTPHRTIQQRLNPQYVRFNLLHIDKLTSKQKNKTQPVANQSFIQHLRNRGVLSSIRKHEKERSPSKVKPNTQQKRSDRAEQIRQNCYTSVCKAKQKKYIVKKRFSTECRNYQSNKLNDVQEIKNKEKSFSIVNPEKGIPILLPRRNNKITINKLLQEKYQKKRQYQFSKFSRTNIIPDYLVYSKRQGECQQRRLIRNISQKIYSQYRISPNFQSPKQ